MKERVTLTIEKSILSEVDDSVDGRTIKNRSHAVELLLLKALGSDRPKTVLILAGGRGTRLQPLTHELPKPLIPLHDRPLIEHIVDLFKRYDIKDIIVSVGYKKEKIKETLGNGKHLGVNITYVEEKEPLGTAGPIRLAKPYLNETFIVCNVDELKEIDLREMYSFHKQNHATATIALTTVKDPSIYGVAILKGNRILDFVEKPKKGASPSNLINAGLYMMEPGTINYIPEGNSSLEKDVFPKLAKEGKLFGYPFGGQWYNTGTLELYEQAIKGWKDLEL